LKSNETEIKQIQTSRTSWILWLYDCHL